MAKKMKYEGRYSDSYGAREGKAARLDEKQVEDMQKPAECYSQMYDQAPTRYIERSDRNLGHEAKKLRSEEYYGRYS